MENEYKIDIKPVYCDVCGKSMQDTETSANTIAARFGYTGEATTHIKKQFAPYEVGAYDVCWGCWIKSLGVKPPE